MGPGTSAGKRPLTPLAAVVGGLLAGVVGTPARDLGGHLAYGAGTGTAFWLFVKLR